MSTALYGSISADWTDRPLARFPDHVSRARASVGMTNLGCQTIAGQRYYYAATPADVLRLDSAYTDTRVMRHPATM